MAVKIYKTKLNEFNIDPKLGLKDYSLLFKGEIKIKEYLKNKSFEKDIKSGRTPSRFNEAYWNGEFEFFTMHDIDTMTFTIQKECIDKITEHAIKNEKTLFQAPKKGLLISNAMTIGLSVIIDRELYINQNVFYLDIDETKANKKFLMWYFNTILRPTFKQTFYSKYLSKAELSRIKIPFIPKPIQDQISAKIKPIEQKIRDLKSNIGEPQEIINQVFAREFGLDMEKLARLKGEIIFKGKLSLFSNNKDLRNSYKFHCLAGKYVLDFLKNISSRKIKDFLTEPIVLGAGVSPKYYDGNGEYFYISMASIKSWSFKDEDVNKVSDRYVQKNISKLVQKNDIIMARSGEGTIGKVALIDEEIKGIFCDFTMRIRLKNYNPLFAYYYFRTDFFQFLIEINKKGLGNNTNIFPNQIQEFPLIYLPEKEQKKIVDEIKAELDKQKKIKTEIEEKRKEIDKIIVSALSPVNKQQ